jgi:3-phenylpropionate/trans-cinnamate dioxygenase ferredoxin subunit
MSVEPQGSSGPTRPVVQGRWCPVGPLLELRDDSAAHVDLDGHSICLVRSGGTVYALRDECSHGQVALSEGEVEDGYLECWLHGSRFDLTTGVPAGPPATRPVPVYPVRVTKDGFEVAVPAALGR